MTNHQVKFATALVLTVAVMMSTSCTSPQITRRYASAILPEELTGSDVVDLSLFSMNVPVASTQTTLISLGERAQAALIKELSAKVKDAPSLLHALASPIAKPVSQQAILDRTVVERRVVISIENRAFSPATRIQKASTILSLPKETAADFTSWSQFATKYQTVNLGSVKFTQGSEFSLGVKAALPQIPASPEVTGSAKATRSLEESLNFNQRFVEATGVLTPKEARLVQEGAFGIDLTGNIIVDLTVSIGSADNKSEDIFTFTKLFDGSGKPNSPGAIEMDRQKVIFVSPRACRPVKATAVLEATVREARKGHKTLIEGDDKALYEQVTTTSQEFELVPAQALRFSVWYLVDSRNWAIHIQKDTPNLKSEVLQFGSWAEANDFLLYVHALPGDSPLSVKSRALLLRDKPLRKSDLQGLQAEIQRLNWGENSDCSPQAPPQRKSSSREPTFGK